jgi:serine phosphatase RsbU (regulator of sigma subunit)
VSNSVSSTGSVAERGESIRQEPGEAGEAGLAALPSPPRESNGKGIDLRAFVGHRLWLAANTSLEEAQQFFTSTELEFVAVLEGGRVLGLCARRQIGIALGSRFGFSLFSRNPVREYLLPRALVVRITDPIEQVLKQVSMRPGEDFYDDVLLVNEPEAFLGSIFVRDLVRVQHGLLLENIEQLERRRVEIERQNRQMEQELIMASRVQRAMLPQVYPKFSPPTGTGRLRFEHRYLPAGKVSGDFFHVRRISDQIAGVFICDVMGHGVRSAMITATMRALVEELPAEASQPGAALERLNHDLHVILSQNDETMYASAVYLTIDAASRQVRWATAGHPCPLHLRRKDGTVELMKSPAGKRGRVLGLFDDGAYETCEGTLPTGDVLLLYTDGIFEIFNGDREFGMDGFTTALREHLALPTPQWLDRILEAARAFGSEDSFEDDVCLLAIEMSDVPDE